MVEEKVLTMRFRNSADEINSLNVNSPKSDLTEAIVKSAMNDIIAENIFSSNGAELASPLGAVITTKTENILF